MADKFHNYNTTVTWTGNTGAGTSSYQAYERSHNIIVQSKETIQGSSDPNFMGDPTKYNPEELLVASLSSCHMLWFLHLCSAARVTVEAYTDNAEGIMCEEANGGGQFTQVVLRPQVIVSQPEMIQQVADLHHQAHEKCFIARSVNFDVLCAGETTSK